MFEAVGSTVDALQWLGVKFCDLSLLSLCRSNIETNASDEEDRLVNMKETLDASYPS